MTVAPSTVRFVLTRIVAGLIAFVKDRTRPDGPADEATQLQERVRALESEVKNVSALVQKERASLKSMNAVVIEAIVGGLSIVIGTVAAAIVSHWLG